MKKEQTTASLRGHEVPEAISSRALGLRSLSRAKRGICSWFASALPRNRFTPRNNVGMVSFVMMVALVLFFPPVFAAELLIDDFSAEGANRLGLKASTYIQPPSRALAVATKDGEGVAGTKGLLLKYDKKGEGGPNNEGGWCGYYTLLKSGSRYFDVSGYQTISFQVKGAAGGENFVVGLADHHWDEVGDSVKSEPIGKYLPAGKITAEWQKVAIPLSDFSVDLKELASVAVCFEGSLFPGGAAKGTVYLDDLKLE